MTREQIEKANELLKEIDSVDNIVDMIKNCNSDTMKSMFLECCEKRKIELEKELEEL